MDLFRKSRISIRFEQIIVIISLLFAFSCVQSPSNTRKNLSLSETSTPGNGSSIGHGSTNPDGGDDIDQGDGDLDTSKSAVEVRWFVDPFDGTYQSKLTLPKNFEGILYLRVLNAPSLDDSFVDVRFNFGLHASPVTIPATVARALNGGIIPQTDVKVLVLNFNKALFKDLKLSYDLYDYNTYSAGDTPTTDPRNVGLYCRGLRLEDDPTFSKSGPTGCKESGDECLYAYAKVNDSVLYQNGVDLNPTSTQIDSGGTGYETQSISTTRKKCLPDTSINARIQQMFKDGGGKNFTYGSDVELSGEKFTFLGPYYPSAASLWQITDDAVIGAKGLFKKRFDNAPLVGSEPYWFSKGGHRSLLFPLAGTRTLKKGVQYYGSTDPFEEDRGAFKQLSSDGDSGFMDGCNLRTLYRDDYTSETMASCNVVASIEILAKKKNDDGSITQEVVAKSIDVKLQVVRASDTNYHGEEDIITSFKTCADSNECGSGECCFNKRCWSKNIVSQCVEDSDGFMTGENATKCGSDFQCQSLCCSRTGTCKEHKLTDAADILCGKSPGQSCVAKEWCKPQSVQVCKIYKMSETTTSGQPKCKVYCLPEKVFGNCVNGSCQTPDTPTPEVITDDFNCSGAPNLPQS
ncbi:MAG: hypothetical protein KAG61_04840 [Bacteriovoracaceae bacterium]|nr:hypothetical protein [Bacteriovoracaceae bacterium]